MERDNQKKITDYCPSHVCRICGKAFTSERGLRIHMGSTHYYIHPPNVDEGIRIANDNSYVYISFRLRKDLWRMIRERLMEENRDLVDALVEVMHNLGIYGTRYIEWRGSTVKTDDRAYPIYL